MVDKKLYSLEKITPKESYYEVIIGGDWNDGDYVSRSRTYSKKEFNEVVELLIHVKYFYSEEAKRSGIYRYLPIPSGYECDCHTVWIESIKFYATDETVSNVKLTDDTEVLKSISEWTFDNDECFDECDCTE